jgi:hypothetical protein
MKKIVFACGSALLLAVLPGSAAQAAEPDGLEAIQTACAAKSGQSFGSPEKMRQRIVAYQEQVEQVLTMRARAIDFFDEIKARQRADEPLSGADLRRLNEGAARLLSQRQTLLKVAGEHECWVYGPIPEDETAARVQAQGVALSLSAALLLYDNYLSAVGLYRANPFLRQHLNRKDSGFALPPGELNRIAFSFNSAINRARVRRALSWYEEHGTILAEGRDDESRYLSALIEQSPSVNMVRKMRPVSYVHSMVGFFSLLSVDTLNQLKNEGVNLGSLLFGNAVGLVETRRGKLYGRPEVLGNVTENVRAGDVLLEKTPFRLTDTFIPGHWGHVAMWIGSEAELRDLGIWDHPVVRPHQAAIREGRGVVEALRSGVKMNSLAHFLNVDDLGVLRRERISDTGRAEAILQALRQVGKAYDFNFDVESTDRIVCSELVYHAYGDIRWPVARHLGRVTISPDNVAVEATGEGPFAVALLYHDGAPVTESPRRYMSSLVKPEVVRLARGETVAQ